MSLWNHEHAPEPRDAAAVILLRNGKRPEVLLVQRSDSMRFMPGHHVFPGGRVDEADGAVLVLGISSEEERRFIAAAAREVFEEGGILLAEGELPGEGVLDSARRALLAGEIDFATILDRHGLQLDGTRFIPAGQWTTPPISPVRFRTHFYLVVDAFHPAGTALPEDGEIVGLDWVSPATARDEWHGNTRKLSPPVAYILHQLERFSPVDALPWLRAVPVDDGGVPMYFEFRRGIQMFPLQSPTIPPATHTNTMIVGQEEFVIVDPGTDDDVERAFLLARIAHLEALGGVAIAIVLTHSHPDHVAAVEWLQGERDVPVWAHRLTDSQVEFSVDRHLEDGECVSLAGSPGWEIACHHTPGHDPGHLALLERSTRTLIGGDLVGNPGTIVVSPDWRGDMTDYLASLKRCAELDFSMLIPAHGMPFFGRAGQEKLQQIHAHRLEREGKIKAALDDGANTMAELLSMAYADVAEETWPLAEHQARAHLVRLGVALAE